MSIERTPRTSRAASVPATDGVRINLINHDGGGFAGPLTVPDGTTIGQLFDLQVSADDGASDRYQISCNRQIATDDHVLQQGDRVSFTPVKLAVALAMYEAAAEADELCQDCDLDELDALDEIARRSAFMMA